MADELNPVCVGLVCAICGDDLASSMPVDNQANVFIRHNSCLILVLRAVMCLYQMLQMSNQRVLLSGRWLRRVCLGHWLSDSEHARLSESDLRV